MRASGEFEVKLEPLDFSAEASGGNNPGRMSIDKIFTGDLMAQSKGEMLSILTGVKGSAGYVAIELVNGNLVGLSGSFVLQHFATMDRGEQRLILEVVPDSGTGQLVGLSGTMTIRIENDRHFYELIYELPKHVARESIVS